MTGYLLDANVLREFKPGGHANVASWRTAVPAEERFVSALTVWELRRGLEAMKARDPARAAWGLAAVDILLAGFVGRIMPLDGEIATEWARLLGEKDSNRIDMALAATARVRGLVLVTRNVRDFRGRKVRILDPFKATPGVELA